MLENLEREVKMKKKSSKYRNFVLDFFKITLTRITKECNISRSQIYSNELSEEKERQLKEKIEKEFANLYNKFEV